MMTDTERALWKLLDANPGLSNAAFRRNLDWTSLLVLADYYADHDRLDEERALREIIRTKRVPYYTRVRIGGGGHFSWFDTRVYENFERQYRNRRNRILGPALLPRVVFRTKQVPGFRSVGGLYTSPVQQLYQLFLKLSHAYQVLIKRMVRVKCFTLDRRKVK